ncbi:MAG: peptidylprolyl isomerase [Syntrophaceae bacterium]|nr:peptidylprolyl isomerase [Syntrophaceae bacterium]
MNRDRGGKKILPTIGLLFFLSYGWTSPTEAVVDRIVAVVNQEIITLSEVQKMAAPLEEEIQEGDRLERRQRLTEIRRKVLEKLIEEKLVDQEVKKAGVKVSAKEIEGAVEEVKRRNALTQEDFEKALASEGFTLEAYKKEIEKRLQRTKLIGWAVKVEAKAGEKELRDFYQKNIERYRTNESYRPAQIFFSVPNGAGPEKIREIRKRCEKVLERIKAGEDFAEMALLYSEDISAKDGGDLGYFRKGELLPDVEKEALRLQKGGVSGIIRTSLGFHIIKLLDRKGGNPLPFEEVKEKVQADHYEKEMEKAFQQYLATLKERSVIEIKL